VHWDPVIFSCTIQAQVEVLIIRPFNAAAINVACKAEPTILSRPRLIILDGLDECRTTEAQIHILNTISSATKNLYVPLCFLVASRPEQHICEVFNGQIHGIGLPYFSIVLDNSYQLERDIQTFLQSTFDEIKQKDPSRAYFPTSWPSLGDL